MTIAVLCSIGPDKEAQEVIKVLDAVRPQQADQIVIVMDRPGQQVRYAVGNPPYDEITVIELKGPEGWRSPCIAFNAGLEHVTADITVVCHGDVIMAEDAIKTVQQLMTEKQAVYFAKVTESKPEMCQGRGHAGAVLMASDKPRALTYLIAVPTKALKAIGGWDEAFQKGVCYEDDDLTARLWKHGLDFVFDDRFKGVHQSHHRAYFTDIRIAPNMALMLDKHGTTQVYAKEIREGGLKICPSIGRTEFKHIGRTV